MEALLDLVLVLWISPGSISGVACISAHGLGHQLRLPGRPDTSHKLLLVSPGRLSSLQQVRQSDHLRNCGTFSSFSTKHFLSPSSC